MPTVRTTMRPDQSIEVDDAEYLDLQRQSLLVSEDSHAEVPAATSAPAVPEPAPQPSAAPAAPKKTGPTKES